MKNTAFIIFMILYSSIGLADPTWSHGKIDIVESFSDRIYVRWNGPNTQACSSEAVVLTAASVGGEKAFDRAFKIALTAAVSGKPIRFKLDGCIGNLQKAEVVQLCANPTCEY